MEDGKSQNSLDWRAEEQTEGFQGLLHWLRNELQLAELGSKVFLYHYHVIASIPHTL